MPIYCGASARHVQIQHDCFGFTSHAYAPGAIFLPAVRAFLNDFFKNPYVREANNWREEERRERNPEEEEQWRQLMSHGPAKRNYP